MGLLSDLVPFKVPGKVTFVDMDKPKLGGQPSAASLAALEPAFVQPYGTVTTGNSSFDADGASACLLTTASMARAKNWPTLAYLRDFVYVGHEPRDHMLLGPAYAIPRLLDRNGLTLDDIDVFELHDPYAGQLLANLAALESPYFCRTFLDRPNPVGRLALERVNAWGGAIAFGDPVGASGLRLVSAAVNRLLHQPGQLGLVAIGGPGGLGHAMLIEACHR